MMAASSQNMGDNQRKAGPLPQNMTSLDGGNNGVPPVIVGSLHRSPTLIKEGQQYNTNRQFTNPNNITQSSQQASNRESSSVGAHPILSANGLFSLSNKIDAAKIQNNHLYMKLDAPPSNIEQRKIKPKQLLRKPGIYIASIGDNMHSSLQSSNSNTFKPMIPPKTGDNGYYMTGNGIDESLSHHQFMI